MFITAELRIRRQVMTPKLLQQTVPASCHCATTIKTNLSFASEQYNFLHRVVSYSLKGSFLYIISGYVKKLDKNIINIT